MVTKNIWGLQICLTLNWKNQKGQQLCRNIRIHGGLVNENCRIPTNQNVFIFLRFQRLVDISKTSQAHYSSLWIRQFTRITFKKFLNRDRGRLFWNLNNRKPKPSINSCRKSVNSNPWRRVSKGPKNPEIMDIEGFGFSHHQIEKLLIRNKAK